MRIVGHSHRYVQRNREEHYVKIRVTLSQVKKYLGLPEAGRDKEGSFSYSFQEKDGPANILA